MQSAPPPTTQTARRGLQILTLVNIADNRMVMIIRAAIYFYINSHKICQYRNFRVLSFYLPYMVNTYNHTLNAIQRVAADKINAIPGMT